MLNEMRTFVLFAEEGSLQKVARRLPLTQPAVSRQIQRLEQSIGTSLLDRRQKPPVLTAAGREVLARSREILAAYAAMKGIAAATEPTGVLRLGIANGLAQGSLVEAVLAVMARFPRVSLRLKAGWSAALVEEHRLGMLDAAILLSDGSKSYGGETLGSERLSIIGGTMLPNTLETVCAMPWVLSPEPCDARRLLTGAFTRHGRSLVVAAEVEDAGLQVALVRKGLGLGLMPERILRKAQPEGIVPITAGAFALRLDVVQLRSPHLGVLGAVVDALSPALRDVLEMLVHKGHGPSDPSGRSGNSASRTAF